MPNQGGGAGRALEPIAAGGYFDGFDHVALARRDRLGAAIARLDESRWPEAERALLIARGFMEATPSR